MIVSNSNLIFFNPDLKRPPRLTKISKAIGIRNIINTFMNIEVHRVFYQFKESPNGMASLKVVLIVILLIILAILFEVP